MKKLFSLLLIGSLFSLTGCLEIVRNITINQNGTGSFETKIDMGEVFDMVRSMGQDEKLEEARSKQIDTLVQLKDLAKDAANLTEDEKQLLANGNIRIAIHVDSNLFYAQSFIPFKTTTEIEKINVLSQRFLGNSMDKILDEGKKAEGEEPKEESLLGATFDEHYITSYTANSIEKKINPDNPFPIDSEEATKAFQEMTAMGMDIKSTLVYNLPRPAKKVEGKNAVLSADKKKVTIISGINDIITDPSSLTFKISY